MKYLHVKNRAILREMVATDFKVRYQGSALGYVWSLLKPLFLFAILYVVFTYIFPFGKGIEHYPVYLIIGVVLWQFFAEATSTGATSVVARGDLLRKVSIPRYLVVVSSSVSALINLGLSMIVVVAFALFNGIMPSWEWLLVLPLLAWLFIFAQAVAFILATAYVKYRDITYIWEVVIQAGFYASAIIYPLSMVPVEYQKWFFLNPIVQIVQDVRNIMATPETVTVWSLGSWKIAAISVGVVLIATYLAFIYFRSRSKYFAENI
jgi:ABC-2 type transport system permease protein